MTKRVYIVEDTEWLRYMLEQFIGMQPGLAVCGTAADAETALQAIPDARPDVVTVDLGLGEGLSGLDLVRAAGARWPELPCVVLSGRPEIEVAADLRDAGATAYVEKGDEDELVQTLYRILGIETGVMR